MRGGVLGRRPATGVLPVNHLARVSHNAGSGRVIERNALVLGSLADRTVNLRQPLGMESR